MRSLIIVFAALFLFSCKNVDFAPIYENKTTEKGHASRALGPFYENIKLSNGHERKALRPIWSYEKLEDRVAVDFLWPLTMSRMDNDYYRSNFLLFFYHNMDVKDKDSEYLFWLFPLWFQGTDRESQDYYGLFPIWGSVHDTVGYDYIRFRFFPINLQTKKNEIHTNAWLWPIYSETTGPKIRQWRIWPFYGESHEKDKMQSHFVMWPFWHEGESLVPGKKGEWFFFFPFYGEYNYEDEEKTTFLWPFFSWSKSTKDESIHAPWPFYTKRESKDGTEERFTAWPFYTSTIAPNKVVKQYLWPIGTYSRLGDEQTYEERSWWLPLYWSSKKVKEGKILEDYTRFWPFYSEAVAGERKTISVFSLWPQRHMPAIERNWQNIWEPYRYYNGPEKSSHDILWGLSKYKVDKKVKSSHFSLFPFYETKSAPETSEWNVLKGLFGKKNLNEKESEIQLFWFIKFGVGS